MIECKDVKKIYSGEVEIGPVDVTFGDAGFTAIIGPNGAGKSTTLHMIGRLLKMDSGRGPMWRWCCDSYSFSLRSRISFRM